MTILIRVSDLGFCAIVRYPILLLVHFCESHGGDGLVDSMVYTAD